MAYQVPEQFKSQNFNKQPFSPLYLADKQLIDIELSWFIPFQTYRL